MAGGHYLRGTKMDPAIERWAAMKENVYQHFQWNRRTARVGLIGLVLIPGLFFYGIVYTQHRYDFVGKGRGESLLRVPPAKPAPAANEED